MKNTIFTIKKKTTLIDNGYSAKTYFSSKIKRLNFRKKYKIKKSDIIFGFAGRYTYEKNINSILHAFSKIVKNHHNVYFYMVGKNVNNKNKELMNYLNKLKLKNKVFLLNEQKNLLEFYNGIDLLLLASHSESFPNVIAEAMLCSTPVMSSNVGSSKKIINKYGFIMNNNDYFTIFKNLNKFIQFFKKKKKEWRSIKKNSQLRIKRNFSIEKMANTYFENWNF